jgi:hypothetical protein
MKFRHFAPIFISFLVSNVVVSADIDPCPGKQVEFRKQAASANDKWSQINDEITKAKFDRVQFQNEYRKQLKQLALHDLQDTITALNSTRPAAKKIVIAPADLQVAAARKVELSLARPEMKRAMDDATQQGENAFIQAKADAFTRLAKQKVDLDARISDSHKKLDASCTYDFPSQMNRDVDQVLQVKTKTENDVLTILSFNGKVPVIKGGELVWGDHVLMNVPEVTTTGIMVGGTNVVPFPSFSGGNFNVPVAPGVTIPIKLPDVSIGNGPGLGVHIGGWSF